MRPAASWLQASDRLTLRTGTNGNFEVYVEYQDGTSFTVPTGIADPGTSATVQLEVDDYDADGHDDMMIIQGKPVGQSSVISLGYLAGIAWQCAHEACLAQWFPWPQTTVAAETMTWIQGSCSAS